MAHLKRSAKSSTKWVSYELRAFNIQIVTVDAQTFFGSSQLPDLSTVVSPVILNNVDEPANLSVKADIDFFQYLHDAAVFPPDEESPVADFTAFVLKMMRYDEGHRVIHLRKEMRFEMCGELVSAKADVCVMEQSDQGARSLLIVQEDKRHIFLNDPEAQLIANALAAVYNYNKVRRMYGLPGLTSTIIPGITMTRTGPTFYKIPVTDQLVTAIITDVMRFDSEGMRPLDNRRIYLQCFEAFRQFVN